LKGIVERNVYGAFHIAHHANGGRMLKSYNHIFYRLIANEYIWICWCIISL